MIAPISKNGRRPDCLVLVDAENVCPKGLDDLVREASRHGKKLALCAYGVLPQHKAEYERNGFEIREKTKTAGRHKNLVDMQLTIDAIEIGLKYRSVKTFLIVSSDGDFVPLVLKLTELGKEVISIAGRSPQNNNLLAHVQTALSIKKGIVTPIGSGSGVAKKKRRKRKKKKKNSTAQTAQSSSAKQPAPTQPKPVATPRIIIPLTDQHIESIRDVIRDLLEHSPDHDINLSRVSGEVKRRINLHAKDFGMSWKRLVQENASHLECLVELRGLAVRIRSCYLFV